MSPPPLPPFSVIATVRNERESIAAFVDSLLAQTLAPAEIVIVDGASTDGTLDILQRYARDGHIALISQDCNISEGRNLGIAAASHEWIAATDAGCRAEPDWLEQLARAAVGEEAPDVIAGNYAFETHNDFELASVLATDAPDREDSDQARYYPSSRSIAFRRSAWNTVGGYPEWLYAAEDTLYNIRLRELGLRFTFARDARVWWRPRQTLRGLYRQYFNYARGNGRIGLALYGYWSNIKTHGYVAGFALLGLLHPGFLIAAIAVGVSHVRRNLWPQARLAGPRTGRAAMIWKTLWLMEVVRVAGMHGFLAGRSDRRKDPRFIREQLAWMGRDSLETEPAVFGWQARLLVVASVAAAAFIAWQRT